MPLDPYKEGDRLAASAGKTAAELFADLTRAASLGPDLGSLPPIQLQEDGSYNVKVPDDTHITEVRSESAPRDPAMPREFEGATGTIINIAAGNVPTATMLSPLPEGTEAKWVDVPGTPEITGETNTPAPEQKKSWHEQIASTLVPPAAIRNAEPRPLEPYQVPWPPEGDNPDHWYFPINQVQIDLLVGKILTHLDAIGMPPTQAKANKDLVKQSIRQWFGDVQENSVTSYRGCIAPIIALQDHDARDRKYVWLAVGNHTVSVS